MAKRSTIDEHGEAPAAPATRRRGFVAPEELHAKFGAVADREDHSSGYVATEDVPALLEAFSIEEPEHIAFPFHKMKRKGGELWSMRIEPAEPAKVNNAIVTAHHWAFTRQLPETQASAQ